ncbi:AmpG family muropeptide MFS transporter [Thalassotalea agarivorans]|uniref:MFS transporter, PAT family, beta-lactamase induction signal transducer AmpG n=1 Tax=Thalassotalea agarivorans TaxID=349064 RepID=A0A1H9YG99_THASX|nr:MFS transporter [Thalassotalea agarivorans]SES67606.1 MFS transporter, PAT family, beta-lactamase induction signal transducer AmpG [Thalassotalea agarivorans]
MTESTSFRSALLYFKDKRLVTIFCFGLASGFPWIMIGSAMTAWLSDAGLTRTSIGLFGLIFGAYSFNFMWSPLVDRLKVPYLCKALGQRRGWIFAMQLIIVLSCLAITQIEVEIGLATLALCGLIIAISGATQDIAIDAYRIDILYDKDKNYLAAGSAMATSGWWTGYAGLGSIPFILADNPNWQWQEIYYVLALIMLVVSIATFFAKEPVNNRAQTQANIQQQYQFALVQHDKKPALMLLPLMLIFTAIVLAFVDVGQHIISNNQQILLTSIVAVAGLVWLARLLYQLQVNIHQLPQVQYTEQSPTSVKIAAWVLSTLVAPLQEFFQRNGVKLSLSLLAFIFLFKLGEAYLGRMSIVFYKEVGFSNSDIAYYSKLINWAVTIVFSLIGSIFTIRFGILKGLFIGGIAMASSNLLFAVIALVGPNKGLFAFTVIVDGFTSAWGSVAFVALLSVLCNKTFTASQYALMASLGTLARVLLGSYSGILVDALNGNWALFFVLTALMVIPSLLFLYAIRKPINRLIESNSE